MSMAMATAQMGTPDHARMGTARAVRAAVIAPGARVVGFAEVAAAGEEEEKDAVVLVARDVPGRGATRNAVTSSRHRIHSSHKFNRHSSNSSSDIRGNSSNSRNIGSHHHTKCSGRRQRQHPLPLPPPQ